jgi:hypothetical protein
MESQAKDFHSVGGKLEHLAKHDLGEAYRRYASGYVPVGSGSGIPACARPTIGPPRPCPSVVSSFQAFLSFEKDKGKAFTTPSHARGRPVQPQPARQSLAC